jgi:periplasmic protein CpxP/Spy
MKRALLTSAVLIAGLGLALPVFAQPDRAPGMGGPEHHFGRMCEDQDAHLAGKLAFAEKKLRITDAQRPAWTKFADAARASLKPTQDLCAKFKDQPMPTALPQRLERMETMMQTHLQQLQTVRPALTDLYAQLTPDQQKTADSLLPHRGGPGMGGHGMGHGPRHDGEHGPGPGGKPQDVK